jgi:hypothetical protein
LAEQDFRREEIGKIDSPARFDGSPRGVTFVRRVRRAIAGGKRRIGDDEPHDAPCRTAFSARRAQWVSPQQQRAGLRIVL